MQWLITGLRPVLAVFRALDRELSRIPAVDDFKARVSARWLGPVVVRRVLKPTDSDLHSALYLYEQKLSGDFRFESADIIRWIAEDQDHRSRGDDGPRDYFLVAKHKRKVRAFILFHYYPTRKTAFLAYMVSEPSSGLQSNDLSHALATEIGGRIARDKRLRECKRLLFEVEDPRLAVRSKQLHDVARIQRFCALAASQNFVLRAFDFEYLQPALSVPGSGQPPEQRLLLLSAKAKRNDDEGSIHSEVLEMLNFVYLDLYPEGFSDIPEEQDAYRLYCRELHDRVVAKLPTKIGIINPIHLTCGRAVKKASRRISQSAPN
jgi:hypothetical protein